MYGTQIVESSINKEIILSKISEFEIFLKYCGAFKVGIPFSSPLRKDRNPSFAIFKAYRGDYQLRYKDFSTGESGNCFTFVMNLTGLDYKTTLKKISNDFGINNYIISADVIKRKKFIINEKDIDKPNNLFQIKVRNWEDTDKKFWYDKYNISCKTLLHFEVLPISHFWINERLNRVHNKTYPLYAYRFDLGIYKIYSPREEKRRKWYYNGTDSILQGFNQLPLEGDTLIITKSLKDVMCLYQMGITSIAPQGETVEIPENIVKNLKDRFNTIYLLYDNDTAGVKNSKKLCQKHGFTPLFLPNSSEKDISDFIKNNNFEKGKKLIDEMIKTC